MNISKVTADVKQLEEIISNLSDEEKSKVLYEMVSNDTAERVRDWSVWMIDFLEREQLVNNYETRTSTRTPILGMMYCISSILTESAANQSRVEMQTMNEGSQYGSIIAEHISDSAAAIKGEIETLVALHAAYEGVLYGRRNQRHYIDNEGNNVSFSREELVEDFRRWLKEKEKALADRPEQVRDDELLEKATERINENVSDADSIS
jgi:hypothetical protein